MEVVFLVILAFPLLRCALCLRRIGFFSVFNLLCASPALAVTVDRTPLPELM